MMAQSKLAALLQVSESTDPNKEKPLYIENLSPAQAADRSVQRISRVFKKLFEQRLPRQS